MSDVSTAGNDWFVQLGGTPGARLALVCFPNAGSSASVFRPWRTEIPSEIELLAVQFPGRQKRIKEPPFRALGDAVEALLPAIDALAGRDMLFFGDCTGALVAYELIAALAAAGAAPPRHLIVSCCRAPHLPPRHQPLYALDDDALTGQIRALGFAPEWLLNDQRALKAFLPLLRCDFEMAEAYVCRRDAPLSVPITAIAGTDDRITPESDVDAWRAHTSRAFHFASVRGSHDLIQTQTREMMALLAQAMGGHHLV